LDGSAEQAGDDMRLSGWEKNGCLPWYAILSETPCSQHSS